MKPGGAFVLLIRARVFELVNRFGRTVGRWRASVLWSTVLGPLAPPYDTATANELQFDSDAGARVGTIRWHDAGSVPPAGYGLGVEAATKLALGTPYTPGALVTVKSPNVQLEGRYDQDGTSTGSLDVRASANGGVARLTSQAGPGAAFHLFEAGAGSDLARLTLDANDGNNEGAVLWRDTEGGTNHHDARGFRLSAVGRGCVTYGVGVGGFNLGPGASALCYNPSGQDGTNGAGVGIPVEVKPDRVLRIHFQIRAIIRTAGGNLGTALRFEVFLNGGSFGWGGIHATVEHDSTGGYDMVSGTWLLHGGHNFVGFLNIRVTNDDAANTVFLHLDDTKASFIILEDIAGNRYKSGNSFGAVGPAPYTEVQSWMGPWDDAS